MKRIIKYLKISFLILLVILLLGVIYQKYIKKADIINIFNKSFLIVMSGSMYPTINEEELIIIEKKNEYRENDIVTYKDKDSYIVTHRVIKIDGEKFIAKGDYNNIQDEEHNVNSIYGKVIYHSEFWGFFVLHLLKPIIIIYVVYIFISEIYFIKKEKMCEENSK